MELGTTISAILNVATLGVVSLGAYLISLAKTGFEARVKAGAEEGAKVAIKNENWVRELAQELEKTRGTERQELRFKSYGALWKRLRPLAIYDSAPFDSAAAGALLRDLTDWYFSEEGGLMLTAPVREFYFALQDLLRVIAGVSGWRSERPADPRGEFADLARTKNLTGVSEVLAAFKNEDKALSLWTHDVKPLADRWHTDVKQLAADWSHLEPSQHFAVLQQVASTLRTAMTCDVESRLR